MFQYTRTNALKQSMMQNAGPRRWSDPPEHACIENGQGQRDL